MPGPMSSIPWPRLRRRETRLPSYLYRFLRPKSFATYSSGLPSASKSHQAAAKLYRLLFSSMPLSRVTSANDFRYCETGNSAALLRVVIRRRISVLGFGLVVDVTAQINDRRIRPRHNRPQPSGECALRLASKWKASGTSWNFEPPRYSRTARDRSTQDDQVL